MKRILKKLTIAYVILLTSVAFAQINVSDFETAGTDLVSKNGPTIAVSKVANTLSNPTNNTSTVVRVNEVADGRWWERAVVGTLTGAPVVLNAANGKFLTMLIRSQKASGGVTVFFNDTFAVRRTVLYTQTPPAVAGNLGEWIKLEFDFSSEADIAVSNVEISFDGEASDGNRTSDQIFEFDQIVQNTNSTLSTNDFSKASITNAIYMDFITDILTIDSSIKTETYQVFSLSGAGVKVAAATGSLNVSDLSNGIYFLVTDVGVAKFIKN